MKSIFLRQHRRIVAGFLVLLLALGCTTGIKLYDEAQISQMAVAQFAQMKSEMTVSADPRYNAQVKRVGERIAHVVKDEIPNAEWEFVVFVDDSVNAFAMPGGKIGVNTGLLKLVDSDDELAAVLGHEICHVKFQHGNQRMSAAAMREIGATMVAAAAEHYEVKDENQALILAAYGIGTEIGGMLPFSRNHEYQADQEGLLVAAAAGYDPRAAITFWQKMSAQGGGQPPEYLSTHPNHENRIARLQKAMPAALELYEAHRR